MRTTGHRRLVMIPAGRNTWMMVLSVVDSWPRVFSALLWWWRQWWLLLLRRYIRRRNARKMGQMWRRRRNLMRGGPWRWRMTHVGMRLLLWRLRRMSVNHLAPAKPTSASSFGSHFYGFGIFRCCTITKSTVGVRRSVFHSCSVNLSLSPGFTAVIRFH